MQSCRFCLSNDLLDEEILFSNSQFYVLRNADSRLRDALLVVPHRHFETPFEQLLVEWSELGSALSAAKALIEVDREAPGYTIGWNVGAAGGQSISHAHLHVIARHPEDPDAGKGLRALILQNR